MHKAWLLFYSLLMMGGRDGETALDAAEWRPKLLEWLLSCGLLLATVAFPVIGWQAVLQRYMAGLSVAATLYGVMVVAKLARKLPYKLRALGLLLSLGGFASAGFLRVGFQVGPGIGSALSVVLAGLLLGRAGLLWTFALNLLCMSGIGIFHVQTHGALLAPAISDVTLTRNWVRVGLSYVLFTGVLAAAVSFVVNHIERLLAQRTDALERLRAASLERRKAEDALDEAQRTIAQMQKLEALGRLAGGVAHDFNNALLVILGWADLLRSKSHDTAAVQRGLSEIVGASNHAAGLTRRLLSFGRRSPWVPRVLRCDTLFEEVEGMLRRVLPESIHLKLQLDDTVPSIFADPGEMQQVLLNLSLNARDAMPDGGELRLRAELVADGERSELPPGDWVLVSVSDDGVGMDEATRARVFEPFFTTKGELGSGLGLSVVYGIAGRSGGHVLVDSAPGCGATFSLLLPPSTAEEVRAYSERVPLTKVRTGTILVAEDEAAVRDWMVTVLRAAGHTVLVADNGDVAVEIARRYRGNIDLLCTDGVMPGMTSARLISEYRALFPAGQVLLCTGHSDEVTRRPLLFADAHFLQKPFNAATLNRKIFEALVPDPTVRLTGTSASA